MAWTLADAVTWLKARNAEDGSTLSDGIYKRISNDARALLSSWGKWNFERKETTLVFPAVKTAGTVSIAVDGTALVGVGTAWAAEDADSFFRFDGEPEVYNASAIGGTTTATISAYRGAAALSADTYELIKMRQALPARFRCCDEVLYTSDGLPLHAVDKDQINFWRTYERSVGDPELYAIESAGTTPAAYLWLYPAPSSKRLVLLNYYEDAEEATADANTFALPDTVQAQMVHRAAMRALLYEEQDKYEMAVAQARRAEQMARDVFSIYQTTTNFGQRGDPLGEFSTAQQRPRRIPWSGQ